MNLSLVGLGCCTPTWIAGGQKLQFELQQATTTSIWQLLGPLFLRPPAPEPPSGTQPRVGAGVHLGALQFGKSGASRCPRLGPHGPKMHQMPGKCQFGSFGARSFCSPLLLSPPVGPNHALVLGCTWGLCSLKKVVPHGAQAPGPRPPGTMPKPIGCFDWPAGQA
jgi:hypothetical protein